MQSGPLRVGLEAALVAAFAVFVCACGPATLEEIATSVVRVESLPCGKSGVGSGTVVADALVLTNAHIVAGSTDDVTIRTWDDRVLPGLVVGFDDQRDLALIRVDRLDVPAVGLGEPEVGLAARILARPGGVDLEVIDTRVVRLFNATGDDIYGEGDASRRAIELEADVMPGVSGGGVFNERGDLLGVVFAESRRRESISYAVDAREVVSFLEETDRASSADTLRCR